MKRTILFLSMMTAVIGISAQTNKELLETITEQSQTIGELKATLSMKDQQLLEAKSTIEQLQEENKRLKAQLQGATPAATNMTYKDSLLDLRSKYYACDTWEELLQYVMEPERVKPLMEQYYKKNPYTSEVVRNNNIKITKHQGKKHVLYKVNKAWVVKTADGYKIDWEATTMYNAVSLVEMRKTPGKVYEYRADIADSQKYNERPNTVRYFLGDESCAYMKKNSPIAKEMLSLVEYDEWKVMMVKIKFIKENDTDIVQPYDYEIVEVVSETPSKY